MVDLVDELHSYGVEPLVWDPVASAADAERECGVSLCDLAQATNLNAVIAAVPHKEVLEMDLKKLREKAEGPVPFIDVKSSFGRDELQEAGFTAWRL